MLFIVEHSKFTSPSPSTHTPDAYSINWCPQWRNSPLANIETQLFTRNSDILGSSHPKNHYKRVNIYERCFSFVSRKWFCLVRGGFNYEWDKYSDTLHLLSKKNIKIYSFSRHFPSLIAHRTFWCRYRRISWVTRAANSSASSSVLNLWPPTSFSSPKMTFM